MTRRNRLTALLLGVMALLPSRAWAHDPALSGVRVLLRAHDVVITVSTHVARLRSAAGLGDVMTSADVDRAIGARLHVRLDGADVVPLPGHLISDATNDLLTWQMIRPGTAQRVDVLSRLYPEDATARTVVTIMRDGQASDDVLLDAEQPSYLTTEPAGSLAALAGRYVRMGIAHILSGPDHVLFVLGLLLLGQSLGAVLRTITAFTIAHSITLSIAALGLFVPSARIVEPLIALSIVTIAFENLRARVGRRLRLSAACRIRVRPRARLRLCRRAGRRGPHGARAVARARVVQRRRRDRPGADRDRRGAGDRVVLVSLRPAMATRSRRRVARDRRRR